MLKRSALSIPISFIMSLLHVGCCLFPWISIAAGSASHFNGLIRYKPLFLVLQILLVIYLSILLVRFYLGKYSFHNRLENWSYHIAFATALAGLIIGVFEPFRSEQQIMAQKQFELFKTHRQIELKVSGEFNSDKFREDIISIKGVKPTSVKISGTSVLATFRSNQVSPVQIVTTLRKQGYKVAIIE
jgi:copper chaperone CopZ